MQSDKVRARNEIRRRILSMGGGEKESLSQDVCRTILRSAVYKNASAVLSYIPMQDELDVGMVASAALADKKTLAFPQCRTERSSVLPRNSLMFFSVNGTSPLSSQIRQGALCPEPDSSVLEPFMPEGNVLVLVPGRAFCADGRRLGRGKGCYDSFISECRASASASFLFAGVCFGCQVMDGIPSEAHDERMDIIFSSPLSMR